jgi:hypothetical protein
LHRNCVNCGATDFIHGYCTYCRSSQEETSPVTPEPLGLAGAFEALRQANANANAYANQERADFERLVEQAQAQAQADQMALHDQGYNYGDFDDFYGLSSQRKRKKVAHFDANLCRVVYVELDGYDT